MPQEATGIFFAVLLSGPGTVWLNLTNFEVVGLNIPTTGVDGVQKSDELMNWTFENLILRRTDQRAGNHG